MKTVVIVPDAFDHSTWKKYRVEDICAFLCTQWPEFPPGAAIYHNDIDPASDVTPQTVAEIEHLQSLDGTFYVVTLPKEPATIAYIVVAIFVAAVAFAMTPDVPVPNLVTRNAQQSSPNNELSARTNRARPNARIPDIYGEVISVPDLLAPPYTVYEEVKGEHIAVEFCSMCIGRGQYQIGEVLDDTTPIAEIDGSAVSVYGPNTSADSGDPPQLQIGEAITEPLLMAVRMQSVNGQVLLAPNDNAYQLVNNVRFALPDPGAGFPNARISANPAAGIDFTQQISVGQTIQLDASSYYVNGWAFAGGSTGALCRLLPGGQIEVQDAYTYENWVLDRPGGNPNAPPNLQPKGGMFNLTGVAIINGVPTDIAGRYVGRDYSVTPNTVILDNPHLSRPFWANVTAPTDWFECFFVNPQIQNGISFDGNYVVAAVTSHDIQLSSPAIVNDSWNLIGATGPWNTYVVVTPYAASTVIAADNTGVNWVGPFTVQLDEMTNFICNFVGVNGVYKDDGAEQTSTSVQIELEYTPLDEAGDPIANPTVLSTTIVGSAVYQTQRASTVRNASDLPVAAKYRMRARRITPKDFTFDGRISDEIRWRDLYATKPVFTAAPMHFGDVTTVQSLTRATTGALVVKERKLNMRVTRMIKTLQKVGSNPVTLSAGLSPSKNAMDIIAAISLDPYIGNRLETELDLDNLYDTAQAIRDYFNVADTPDAPLEFCYTFDSDNLSYEESVAMVANAAFCVAYRQGSKIKVFFERETDDSVLLFCHRNKLPRSEKRTVTFGTDADNDGLEFEYTDPEDDAKLTLYRQGVSSSVRPRKVDGIGIRNTVQANLHAHRIWNKMLYQRIGVEFECTQEADLLTRNMRVLVADNTRPHTQDGEVIEVSGGGLTLKLSQPVDISAASTIFLQSPDGYVSSSPVSAGVGQFEVVLGSLPAFTIQTDPEGYAQTTYIIVRNDELASNKAVAFLVSERKPKDNFTSSVTAVNYDARYYANDGDYS